MKCRRCGNELADSLPKPVHWPCIAAPGELCDFPGNVPIAVLTMPGAEAKEPSIGQKAVKYSKAVTRWLAAGRPTRSINEIEQILSICRGCDRFILGPGRPRCGACGCSVNNSPDGLKNKIAMSTESCPLDPPKWTAIVP